MLVLDASKDIGKIHAITMSGSSAGQQQSKIIFGDNEKSKLERVHEGGDEILRLISSDAGIDISGSHALGVAIYGGDGDDAGVLVEGANGLVVVDSTGNNPAVSLGTEWYDFWLG